MDKVVYYNILMKCKYREFMNLSKTCKKVYRVARIIWKEWLDIKFKNIFTFVDQKDYYKLLKILSNIMNSTLRDDTSVLVIYGPTNSGKSRLAMIIKLIHHDHAIINVTGKWENDVIKLSAFSKSIVFTYDLDCFSYCEQNDIANKIHKRINRGIISRNLYEMPTYLDKSGTAIIITNEKLEIEITNESRYPEYLELPHVFHKYNDKIISDCVNELKQYL